VSLLDELVGNNFAESANLQKIKQKQQKVVVQSHLVLKSSESLKDRAENLIISARKKSI
jgi:hypothetical protein